MISIYARAFGMNPATGLDHYEPGPPVSMSWYDIRKDGMPAWKGRPIERNSDKLIRPFESPIASGHNCFSRGHLITNAGHDGSYENNF